MSVLATLQEAPFLEPMAGLGRLSVEAVSRSTRVWSQRAACGEWAAAYAARAGAEVRVWAPRTTPETILAQIRLFGARLELMDGHIGDCGKASRAWAAESGAMDLSTLREPYRIEGKKTLGLELCLQYGWQMPSAIIYPTGGGTGLIGMWRAFEELLAAAWVQGTPPKMFTVQSTVCAPIVRAFEEGATHATPWTNPWTVASGLRVPGPLADRLILRALAESGGGAVAVTDDELMTEATELARTEGIDCSPEGGAAVAAARLLRERGDLHPEARLVVFNTSSSARSCWRTRPSRSCSRSRWARPRRPRRPRPPRSRPRRRPPAPTTRAGPATSRATTCPGRRAGRRRRRPSSRASSRPRSASPTTSSGS